MKITLCLAVLVLLACATAPDGFAIINGSLETGFAAVGFVADGAGNTGSAVLIDPYWVLTSAAFAEVQTDGSFYLGLDYAAPDAVHAISAAFPHFNYDSQSGDYNIALVRLATPVVGVTPIPYLTNSSALYAGAPVRFVGYGWTSLVDGSNTQRHSGVSFVEQIDWLTFVNDGPVRPFYGDGGGPALFETGGQWYVAGLVAAFAEDDFSYTWSTRVSEFVPYIENVMTNNPPISGVVDDLPSSRLLHATPNPFNPSTEISFVLDEPTYGRLAVFDTRGRMVAVLAEGEFGNGRQAARWDGRSVDRREAPSGVYLVVLRMGERMESRKVVLAR